MKKSIKIICNAKITPYLAVGPYSPKHRLHKICALLIPINLNDDLIITETSKGKIDFSIHLDPIIEERDKYIYDLELEQNLVIRAIRMLENFLQCRFSLDISLYKRIPSCGGLGGGSADAAAVLVGINTFYNLNIPKKVLRRMALKLGSDVPFFLNPGAKWILEFGNKMQRVKINNFVNTALVIPPWLSKTATAYANLKKFREANSLVPSAISIPQGDMKSIINLRHNDLTNFHDTPLMASEIQKNLQASFNTPNVILSGSGACWVVFQPQTLFPTIPYVTLYPKMCKDTIKIIG